MDDFPLISCVWCVTGRAWAVGARATRLEHRRSSRERPGASGAFSERSTLRFLVERGTRIELCASVLPPSALRHDDVRQFGFVLADQAAIAAPRCPLGWTPSLLDRALEFHALGEPCRQRDGQHGHASAGSLHTGTERKKLPRAFASATRPPCTIRPSVTPSVSPRLPSRAPRVPLGRRHVRSL